jgi:hypothetical protein
MCALKYIFTQTLKRLAVLYTQKKKTFPLLQATLALL